MISAKSEMNGHFLVCSFSYFIILNYNNIPMSYPYPKWIIKNDQSPVAGGVFNNVLTFFV